MKILSETMVKVQMPGKTVRIWVQETDDQTVLTDRTEIFQRVREMAALPVKDMANHIIQWDGVNAVEVLDGCDCGPIRYKDWP